MIDLKAACQRTAVVLANVTEDQLNAPTPCENLRVDQLVAHLGGLALTFAAAGRKDFGPLTDTQPTFGDGPEADWRTEYPRRLADLARAFADPASWKGMSRAGGVDFPGEVAGIVALTEVVIHGWDLAQATGQPYEVDDATAAAVLANVTQIAAEDPVEGLFKAAVPVAADAPELDRMVALTGRDPNWRAQCTS